MLPFEHSAILFIFIKLPFVIKIFVLSIFGEPFYTGFTVKTATMILYPLAAIFKDKDNAIYLYLYVSLIWG